MNEVIVFGDVHLGAGTCDIEEVMKIKERYWLGKPCISMGDICDFGIDRGMNFDNKYNPQKQIELAKDLFKDLDIRAYVLGNHCNRLNQKVGLNFMKIILDKEPRHEVEIDGCSFYMSHGKSAARNPLTEFTKFYEFVDADIMALGHNHVLGCWNIWRGGRRVVLCRTGSFIGHATYARENGYAPTIKGWISVNTKSKVATCYALINGRVLKI
jgi:predicted phosphodiesterase